MQLNTKIRLFRELIVRIVKFHVSKEIGVFLPETPGTTRACAERLSLELPTTIMDIRENIENPGFAARSSRRAFTLLEMLILAAIIGVLTALLIAGFSKTVLRAKSAACAGNLRQMMTAFIAYGQENGRFPDMAPALESPASDYWDSKISPYLNDGNTNLIAGFNHLRCPLETNIHAQTYGVNYSYDVNPPVITYSYLFGGSISPFKVSGRTLLMADAFGLCIYNRKRWPFDNAAGDGNSALTGPYSYNAAAFKRHRDRINAAFVDGSMKILTLNDWKSETNIWGY